MCSVLIAEDDMNIISFYKRFLTNEKNVEIVGIAYDGESAISMYKNLDPDLLILDLGLPKMDGLKVINELCSFEVGKKENNIIVVTGDLFLRQNLFNTKKVYRIVPKPNIYNELLDAVNSFIDEHLEDKFPKEKLVNLLIAMNLKPYSNSCTYLIDAISLAYANNELLDNIEKIYGILAMRYNCSSEKIKSSIRSSIRTANRFATKELLCSIFFITGYDPNKIVSPKYFINCIIYYLNNNIIEIKPKKVLKGNMRVLNV